MTIGGEGSGSVVPGKQPLTQRKKNNGEECGLQETAEGAPPYLHRRARSGEGGKLKFLGIHITDKLKRTTHTDSVVKKVQQSPFNLRRLKKCGLSPKSLTSFYRRLVWQLHRLQPQGSHYRQQTTCSPGHLQHPTSQEGQKDHQGHQPPEPLPVYPAVIQMVRSVQVHQSWDREIESVFQSQGHQTCTLKAITSTLKAAAYRHRLEITGHFNKWRTSHFHMYILYSILFYCISFT